MTFSRNDLPLLGVTWRQFPTLAQARQFAAWAERETSRDEYPCESFVTFEPDYPAGEQYEVKTRNW